MTTFKYSVIISYYNNHNDLLLQFSVWSKLNNNILNDTEFIIIDDGSQVRPITCDIGNNIIAGLKNIEICEQCKLAHKTDTDTKLCNNLSNKTDKNSETSCTCKKLHVRFYRIKKDIGFNNLGARNIGAFVALGKILVFLDMDCLLINDDIMHESSRHLSVAPMHILYFSRYVTDTIEQFVHNRDKIKMFEMKTHPNAFAMTKKRFWAVGAFNEDLSGRYGTDYEFKSRVTKHGFKRISSKHRILVLNNGTRRRVHKKTNFPHFPTNHLRLPWEHVWSSVHYVDKIRTVPESKLSVRVVPIDKVSRTFPVLDIPQSPRSHNLAKNHINVLFGIPNREYATSNEITNTKDMYKHAVNTVPTSRTFTSQPRLRKRNHTKNTRKQLSKHFAKRMLNIIIS